MATSLLALLIILRSLIRSRIDLQLENLALRHQNGVLQRSLKKRPKLTSMDRLLGFSVLYLARLALHASRRQAANGCGLASHGLSLVLDLEGSAGTTGTPRDCIERVIGSIRRECLDQVIVFNEGSLRRILASYFD